MLFGCMPEVVIITSGADELPGIPNLMLFDSVEVVMIVSGAARLPDAPAVPRVPRPDTSVRYAR